LPVAKYGHVSRMYLETATAAAGPEA